ncbi:3'-5' exonuclease [Desertivirga xinjiangensis]|uniref:3'-5' exonuclease n=1 Tax=Desertivirga xinjiangensis TaxID=539206 RepID=UPI00210D6AEC|nr:3'-5' exonuclease [Pedobacter xinjiangensis]
MSFLHTFTALDFETAQGKRNSICQIGLVRVELGVITKKLSLLVRPPDNSYSYYNTLVHGIGPMTTRNAPTFDKVWPLIEPYICNQNIVAHNSSFDVSCLQQTLSHYRVAVPEFQSHCTYKIYKQKLNVLCDAHGIKLQHHNALSDALACAELFIRHNQTRMDPIVS